MRSNWHEIPKGDVAHNGASPFSVSMNAKGHIMMSKRTWSNMGEPKAFQVLFDNVNSRIGLKPAALAARNAYKVSPYHAKGGKMIYANRLLLECRISLPHTIKFVNPETDDDGILVLDMRTAKKSVHAEARERRLRSLATNGTNIANQSASS